jgi:hypothetical protein
VDASVRPHDAEFGVPGTRPFDTLQYVGLEPLPVVGMN